MAVQFFDASVSKLFVAVSADDYVLGIGDSTALNLLDDSLSRGTGAASDPVSAVCTLANGTHAATPPAEEQSVNEPVVLMSVRSFLRIS